MAAIGAGLMWILALFAVMSLIKYMKSREETTSSKAELESLRRENESLRMQVDSLTKVIESLTHD